MLHVILVGVLANALFSASSLTPQQTIAAAVLPLPEALRGGAAVVRLDAAGRQEFLRKGTNGMVCMTDKPGDEEFDVRCYHETFIPVVYRALQLGPTASNEQVAAEIKEGKLTLSDRPSAGYRCLGPASGHIAATNSLSAEIMCWQSIHLPFRTAREIGLPDETELGDDAMETMPYVMSGGGYWAHVMILHPKTR